MTTPNTNQTNRLLGYPADARLLLINADDFGMCHAINAAIIQRFRMGSSRPVALWCRAPGRSTRSRGCKQRLPFPLVCI